jgi:hypothetical protein
VAVKQRVAAAFVFHDVTNAHALGPALQPTVGSPNPMLTSIALGRRLANHLVPVAPIPAEGPRSLFNGQNLDGWEMAGQGSFVVTNGVLQAVPGGDLGLLWCTIPTPRDFVLRCEWRLAQPTTTPGCSSASPIPTARATTTPPTSRSTSVSRSRSTRPAPPTAPTSTAPAPSTASRTRPSTCSRRSQSASGTPMRSGSTAPKPDLHRMAQRHPGHPVQQPARRPRPTQPARRAKLHRPAGPHRQRRLPQHRAPSTLTDGQSPEPGLHAHTGHSGACHRLSGTWPRQT